MNNRHASIFAAQKRTQHATALALLTCLLWWQTAAYSGDGGWIYPAVGLLSRFEGIKTLTLPEREAAYVTLREELTRLEANFPTGSRDQRNARAFSLWLLQRIYRQLGDAAAAKDAGSKYASLREGMSAQDAELFTLFFDCFGRSDCHIAVRDNRISVNARDYPINELLAEMARALNERIDVPPVIGGLVDLDTDGWLTLEQAFALLSLDRGILVNGSRGNGFTVTTIDPLYAASMRERADRMPHAPAARRPPTGITSGYVIILGTYIPTPYAIETQTTDAKAVVCVNGIPIHEGVPLRMTVEPRVKIPASGQFDVNHQGDLATYLGQENRRIATVEGKDAAIKALSDFLRKQNSVRSFRFTDGGASLTIIDADGMRFDVLLYSLDKPMSEQKPRNGVAEAQELSAAIRSTLMGGGLVLVTSPREPRLYSGTTGRAIAHRICAAAEECARIKEGLAWDVFGGRADRDIDLTWEIMLGIRYRELSVRLRQNGMGGALK